MAGSTAARRLVALALLALAGSGCARLGISSVRVRAIATSADQPSNVAAYLGVTDQGEPLTDLDAQSFRVYEDGKLLANDEIKTTLLPRELVTSEHVVLLVDLSGEVTDEERASTTQAVEGFVRKLQTTLPVTVLAYAGGETLKKVGEYARASSTLAAPPPSAISLAKLTTPDASRDLNGAVLLGLKELDARLETEGKPVHLGTLVVFARGPDLAGRVSNEELSAALDASQNGVIGIGVEAETPYLEFAHNGVFRADDPEKVPNAVPIAFEEAASRIMKAYRKYYLVAYCSPARSGKRSVRVEVVHQADDGSERRGDGTFEFDASGFRAGCNAETTPTFAR